MLTLARLKELLTYDPETGDFYWLIGQGKRTDLLGQRAGFDSNGYVFICVDYRKYPAHRLAWLYVHGVWPEHEIDHINRVRADNRLANLRLATHAENLRNQPIRSNNHTGVVGVSFDAQTQKWRATITLGGKTKSLGRYFNIEDAIAARSAAEPIFFGSFARAA